MSSRYATRLSPRLGAAALALLLISAGGLFAHDFWLVPNALAVAAGDPLEILGQSGSSFPASDGATRPAQVAEARVVGASSDEQITDFSMSGKSLVIRHRPAGAGQRIVALVLVTRTARTASARLQRFVAIEGAPELAAQYEREGTFPKTDSVTLVTAKYAKAIVEIGSGGRRAFHRVVGHALEIVPLRDPALLEAGDSLGVRLLFRGKPAAHVHLRAGSAPLAAVTGDSAALALARARAGQVIVTDADGVARLRITEAGLWNVRTLYAAPEDGKPGQWEALFATIVFSVQAGSGTTIVPPVNDSAAVVAAVTRFHAALAAGDSGNALALLTDDVTILESGEAETKSDYRTHHVRADMEGARSLPGQRTTIAVRLQGDVAWVTTSTSTRGTYHGRPVNAVGAELMVLSREAGGWRIRAIHWLSHARRTGG